MKLFRNIFLIAVLILLLVAYLISFNYYGNKERTLVNTTISTTLTNRPRLEDDFYDYINYDYLSEDKLKDEEISHINIDKTKKIDEEKEKIIKELIAENNDIGVKINNLYNSYLNNTEEEAIMEINKYIDRMNSSNNIQEFVKNSFETNYELGIDLLLNPNVLYNYKGNSKKYFGLDFFTYDWNNIIGIYSLSDYDMVVRMYKKYDIQLLKKYGYSSKEAIEITESVQKMYESISRFSEINPNKLLEKGYKVYNLDDLQTMLNNIPLNDLVSYYKEFCNEQNEILLVDLKQLKQIDDYLIEDNLDVLKKYATLKILSNFAEYISEDYYNIYFECMRESYFYFYQQSTFYDEEDIPTKEELGYKHIYSFFKDTVTEKFAEKYFTTEQKDFYTKLVQEEIETLKTRIKNEDWLSDKTKEKALTKMEKMSYTVGVPNEFVKVENKYVINENNSYISNIINMEHEIKLEEMRQYLNGNITYNLDEIDQLTVNAFYYPNNNSINILLGYIYSLTDALDLEENNLEDNYYKILGSMGTTIGHELTHALDTQGCKYDEYGNYTNWWTEEDQYNFNKQSSKVVLYYDKFEQYGKTTLAENIADLGGMAIIHNIAEKRNATDEDYKQVYEAHAMNWASQSTSLFKEYLLEEDNHSPNKNRVNAVLSSLDKFYEVYNIKNTDKMYVKPENRVSVW